MPTHVLLDGQLRIVTPGDLDTGFEGGTTAWVNANVDIALGPFAAAAVFMVHSFEQGAAAFGPVQPDRVAPASLIWHAARALRCSTSIACPLAGAFRGLNAAMPHHLDQDRPGPQTHYYLRGDSTSPSENDGCRLLVWSGRHEGQVAEMKTDPMDEGRALAARFAPSEQLHGTDSSPEGPSGRMDPSFLRIIPFDNMWLTAVLDREGVARGIRLAPLHPLPRPSITCSVCGRTVGCPTVDAANWIEHFTHSVQRAAERSFECTQCL